jgi:hypothetical protein
MRLTALIVAFSLTTALPVYAEEYAIATNKIGGSTVLTDLPCRFDKRLPEAYTTDSKGTKTYACYWFGVTKIFFEPEDKIIRSLPKKEFVSIKDLI